MVKIETVITAGFYEWTRDEDGMWKPNYADRGTRRARNSPPLLEDAVTDLLNNIAASAHIEEK